MVTASRASSCNPGLVGTLRYPMGRVYLWYPTRFNVGKELLDGNAIKCSRKKNSENGFQIGINKWLLTNSPKSGRVREESFDSTHAV